MPHKGLQGYPYHPNYWATEGWFWRGFMPWKMTGMMLAPGNPPWDAIPHDWVGFSDAGICSTDSKVITYHWSIVGNTQTFDLHVSCDRVGSGPLMKCRWLASIGLPMHVWATAFCVQDYPQYTVQGYPFDLTTPSPPYTSAIGPPLFFQPSTWFEGGSPWP